jgi:hypothetical protein
VGFVVDKMALGQDFSEFFAYSPVSFHHGSAYLYIILRMKNRPVGGHSS